jgi:hypothetical protein
VLNGLVCARRCENSIIELLSGPLLYLQVLIYEIGSREFKSGFLRDFFLESDFYFDEIRRIWFERSSSVFLDLLFIEGECAS